MTRSAQDKATPVTGQPVSPEASAPPAPPTPPATVDTETPTDAAPTASTYAEGDRVTASGQPGAVLSVHASGSVQVALDNGGRGWFRPASLAAPATDQ